MFKKFVKRKNRIRTRAIEIRKYKGLKKKKCRVN